MNHYKIGLETQVRIGAVEWGVTQYQDMANQLWGSEVKKPFAVISITRNGAFHLISEYDNKDEASDHYGNVADNPGTAAYVAYFDSKTTKPGESPLIDSAYFIAPQEETPAPVAAKPASKKQGSNLGLIAAVTATAIGGMVFFGGKKKRGV